MILAPGKKVLALSGGVGGAKLALGLARVLEPEQLTVVANTADDFEHLGLHIAPDLDTVMYTLAGLNNPQQGWGLAGESWQCLDALAALGGEDWFRLGDKDLATHLQRTEQLRQGRSLSQVTRDLCGKLGVQTRLLPMTDGPVRTMVQCAAGEMPFQQYFVREQCRPVVTGFRFDGIESARPQPEILQLLQGQELAAVIICPSNPFVSVDPILKLPGLRQALLDCSCPLIAVSPIVGGEAIKGPAAKMLRELGREVSAAAVAEHYHGLVNTFVLDEDDATLAAGIRASGMDVTVAPTIMRSLDDREQLARVLIDVAGGET
ncbi:MAG: 2-phospho-L-lactate transferase [Halieaceae bacterium]